MTYGFKPDCVKPVKEMAGTKVDQVYIGTCTNGRIEDLREAAADPQGAARSPKIVRGIVSPATPKIFQQAWTKGSSRSSWMPVSASPTRPAAPAWA